MNEEGWRTAVLDLKSDIVESRRLILENRDTIHRKHIEMIERLDELEKQIDAQIDDLNKWRYYLMGVIALVSGGITAFGKELIDKIWSSS